MSTLFDELVDKHKGMVVTVFGKRCDEMTKEELIALLSWSIQQNEKLRHENSEASIAHIRDLAAMAKRRLPFG